MAEVTAPFVRRVAAQVDVEALTRRARAFTRGEGFDAIAIAEIELIVSELAMNVLRHSSGGEVTLAVERSEGSCWFCVVASDCGPGMPDVAAAFADGFSSAASLGLGLGAVRRLSDDLVVESTTTGTHITARKRRA